MCSTDPNCLSVIIYLRSAGNLFKSAAIGRVVMGLRVCHGGHCFVSVHCVSSKKFSYMVSLNGHLRRSNKLCELSDLFAIDLNKKQVTKVFILVTMYHVTILVVMC